MEGKVSFELQLIDKGITITYMVEFQKGNFPTQVKIPYLFIFLCSKPRF
jgi:hypothetical protein